MCSIHQYSPPIINHCVHLKRFCANVKERVWGRLLLDSTEYIMCTQIGWQQRYITIINIVVANCTYQSLLIFVRIQQKVIPGTLSSLACAPHVVKATLSPSDDHYLQPTSVQSSHYYPSCACAPHVVTATVPPPGDHNLQPTSVKSSHYYPSCACAPHVVTATVPPPGDHNLQPTSLKSSHYYPSCLLRMFESSRFPSPWSIDLVMLTIYIKYKVTVILTCHYTTHFCRQHHNQVIYY